MIRPKFHNQYQRQQQQGKTSINEDQLKQLLQDKPFWIEDKDKHREIGTATGEQCCFNHIVGLPTKHGQRKKIFDYELDIIKTIERKQEIKNSKNRHIFILKATGLGITELFLRYMLWLCLARNDVHKFTQMCIVVGPNMRLANKLLKRAKDILYQKLGYQTNDNQSSFQLCNVNIETYPSSNINGIRSLTNPSFILVDEGDLFVKKEWRDIVDAVQRYGPKSDPIIALVSTPNKPGGMFDTLEKIPEDKSFYTRFRLDYKVGLGKIFTEQEINEAILTNDSFEREYNLKYLGKVGNVFSISDINAITTTEYDPFDSMDPFIGKAMGIDEGFESSATGIVIQQYKDHKVEIVYADQMEHASIKDVVEFVHSLINKHYISKVFVDASSPGFIRDLKQSIGEYKNYERYTKEELHNKIYKGNMIICPIYFGNNNDKTLLYNAKNIVEKHRIRIHPQFDKLITSLKTAYAEDMDLDKEQTSFDDILDAFRLSLQNVKFMS